MARGTSGNSGGSPLLLRHHSCIVGIGRLPGLLGRLRLLLGMLLHWLRLVRGVAACVRRGHRGAASSGSRRRPGRGSRGSRDRDGLGVRVVPAVLLGLLGLRLLRRLEGTTSRLLLGEGRAVPLAGGGKLLLLRLFLVLVP